MASSSEWTEASLGEVLELKRGYDLPKDKRTQGHVPIVSSSGVSDFHFEAMVKGPGVVTGRYGTIGEVFYVEEDYWPLNTTLYVRDFKGNDPRFISYFLKTLDFQAYSDKGAVPGVNRNHLHLAKVRVPDLGTQIRIARILGVLDNKIDSNRRINQTLEAMAQAIFKSWFVDFDPVKAKIAAKAEGRDPLRAAMTAISGKPDAELDTLPPDQFAPLAATAALFPGEMEDSELGEIPQGWTAASFGSLLTHTIGGDWGSDVPDATNDTRVAIVRGTDLPDLDQAQANRVPVRYTTQKKLANRRMQVGDLVLEVSGGSRDQPTGRSFRMTVNAMNEFDCPVEPASFCRLLRPVSPEIGVILGLHLSHIYQQGKTWEYQNQSTGIANFQTAHFLEAELVARPPTAVADAFFKMVNPILEQRHDPQGRRLAELRDTLLPKLLSGELQVNNTVAEVTA